MGRNKSQIGMSALALSFFSLVLSFFPPCLIERKIRMLEQACRDTTTSFSYDMNSCGKNGECGCASEAEQCARQMRKLCLILRLCNAAMLLTAGAAGATALCAYKKERCKEFCLYSIVSVSVALAWQHVGALLAAGIAMLLFTALFFLLGAAEQEK